MDSRTHKLEHVSKYRHDSNCKAMATWGQKVKLNSANASFCLKTVTVHNLPALPLFCHKACEYIVNMQSYQLKSLKAFSKPCCFASEAWHLLEVLRGICRFITTGHEHNFSQTSRFYLFFSGCPSHEVPLGLRSSDRMSRRNSEVVLRYGTNCEASKHVPWMAVNLWESYRIFGSFWMFWSKAKAQHLGDGHSWRRKDNLLRGRNKAVHRCKHPLSRYFQEGSMQKCSTKTLRGNN